MKMLNSDYKKVFDACYRFCSECGNCAKNCQNCINFCQKPDKKLQNGFFSINGKVCDTMLLLSQIASINLLSSTSQFERIKYYFDIKSFFDECCLGNLGKNYSKKFDREWAQVVLYTYNSVPNICKMIEDVVDERALARSLSFGLNVYNENTFAQAETILNFIDRKTKLVNFYVRAKRAVDELDAKLFETAKIRFFERKNVVQMSEKLKVSVRTCQRRTEKLLDDFSLIMKRYGLDAQSLYFDIGKTEPWMLEWFRLDLKTVMM